MRLLCLFLLSFISSLGAQSGVLYNSESAYNGYILYPDISTTYLVDNCGNIINTWDVGSMDIHLHPKLLDNGNLIVIREGFTYYIEEYDWEGNVVAQVIPQRSDFFFTL